MVTVITCNRFVHAKPKQGYLSFTRKSTKKLECVSVFRTPNWGSFKRTKTDSD